MMVYSVKLQFSKAAFSLLLDEISVPQKENEASCPGHPGGETTLQSSTFSTAYMVPSAQELK